MRRVSKLILDEPSLVFSWFLILSASLATIGVWIYFREFAVDFGVFWRTARESVEIVYTPHAGYPFPYPPSALPFISPLALIPKWPAFAAWTLLSAAALWAAFRPALGLWPSIMVMVSPPVISGLWTGQSTMFLAAAILWGLRTDRRFVAGIAFGAVATIKPQLVLFLPLFLLLRRDWAALVGAAVSATAVLAVTTGLYGVDLWRDWLEALPRFRQTLYDLDITGAIITFPSLADRLGLSMIPFMVAGALAGTMLVVRSVRKDFVEAAAALAIASFFVAPYALTYDLILAVPYLVRHIFRRDILPTLAIAVVPNPMPLFLAVGTFLGARFDLADLTARVRRPATE